MADEHIFKPKLLKGLIFGIFLCGWSGCLAIGLALIAIDLSFGVLKVLAFGASFFAALVMIFFFYWVLCFLKLRYTVKDNNLTVHWGLVAHVIPLSSITRISVTGYSDDVLVDMFSWPGMSIGRGFSRLDSTNAPKPITIFATSRDRQNLLYLETSNSLYGISVSDDADFLEGLGAYGYQGTQDVTEPYIGYIWPRVHLLISSGIVWVYLIVIALTTIFMWSEFSFRYANLPIQLEGVFPISEEKSRFVTFWLREELFQIPLLASLLVIGNTILGLVFFVWERKLALMALFSAIVIPVLSIFLFELAIYGSSG
tara:strand:+ start:611 stop:1549 length:939 start_codon:yes stop_codon:yes gene_type:complete